MKTFKAVMRIYRNQLIIIVLSMFLVLPLLALAIEIPWLFSLITSLIYVMTMYSSAWHVGALDSRKIPGYFPDKTMPVKMAVFTAIVPIILLILRLAAPDLWTVNLSFMKGGIDFLVTGCRIEGTPDFIFRIWYFMFAAFVPSGNIAAYIAQMFVLPILIFVGYYVGLKKFSLAEFLYARIVFSKSSDEAKGKKHRREDNLRR